jgi:EmrB/QacA subfamily drug resistance transporter
LVQSLRNLFSKIDYKYLVASAFVFGLFMDILDTTIVNVALPVLGQDFGAGTAQLEWVVTGYLLSLAVWIPASGWIGDRFGTKRTFLFATAMFVLGSALCGAAWSIQSLVVFRILQGVGGGMLTPVGTAMLYRAFTPAERARASAILSIPTMTAPMLGPVVGGFLVTYINWRWIFYLNLPVGLASLAFSWLVLREHREPAAGKFDPLGFVLSGGGLAAILYALSEGAQFGWTTPIVLGSAAVGVVCFSLLVVVERKIKFPLLDLSLYASRLFRTSNLIAIGFFAAQFGLVFLLPLFLQETRGLSALESGLTTFPQAIAQILMVQVTSRIYWRLGARRNLIISSIGLTLTAALFLLVGLDTDLWWIRGLMLLRGSFMAFNMVAMQTAVFSAVPREKTGRASSLFSTARQVAAAFGVAIAATVLSSQTNGARTLDTAARVQAGLTGFHYAIASLLILGLFSVFFALRLRDSDPAAARQRAEVQRPTPVAVDRLANAAPASGGSQD